jgi:ribosomal protein S27E
MKRNKRTKDQGKVVSEIQRQTTEKTHKIKTPTIIEEPIKCPDCNQWATLYIDIDSVIVCDNCNLNQN